MKPPPSAFPPLPEPIVLTELEEKDLSLAAADAILQYCQSTPGRSARGAPCHGGSDRRAEGSPGTPPEPQRGSLGLAQRVGVFVTILSGEELRGCLGMADGREPLREAVPRLALAASSRDLRFHPIERGELPRLSVEITILGPLVRLPADPVALIEGLDPQICGVYLRSRESTGLLLPQVARRLGWDALELLEQVSLKAGLERDAWRRSGVEIYGFRARCFEAVKPGGLAAEPAHGGTVLEEPEAAP